MVVNSPLEAIGNTPVIRLQHVVPVGAADVLVKLEGLNPTGSYKDRMALAMIEQAEKRADLKKGMTVVEFTGGSTGSSLAFICATKGYTFYAVSSDAFAKEKLDTMRAFGAEVEIVKSIDGKITPDLIPRMTERVKEVQAKGNTYFTDQLNNADSKIGYANIGYELLEQVDTQIDIFCGAVGTAGMTMGVAKVLKESPTKIVILEPEGSAVISTGQAGAHKVEGIGIGMIPPLLNKKLYSSVRTIKEADARKLVRRLAKEEGIFVGTSSGLNILGAIQLAIELGEGHTVATVACDSGLKYLSGDLFV